MVKERLTWVKQKLTSHPDLRESNERLFYNYLSDIGYDTSKSIKEFLKDMEMRKIPYIDAIGRTSRKVQEEYPELRGKNWEDRTIRRKEAVIKEIRELS